jgi:hypothetical protein
LCDEKNTEEILLKRIKRAEKRKNLKRTSE